MSGETGASDGDGPTLVFVIGAARSGTTWLAKCLGADPRIVATYETHLFNAYLAPLLDTWRAHLESARTNAEIWRSDGTPPISVIGLPYVVDEPGFTSMVHDFVTKVFDSIAVANPEAEVIVEKTPSHSMHVADIDMLTGGNARYVHIIRNGYDVVASTNVASSGWAADWAPRDPGTAARKWAAAVRNARHAAAFGDRYLEVRYEDLLATPEDMLLKIMRHIGIDATVDDARRAVSGSDAGLFIGGAAADLFEENFDVPIGFRRKDKKQQSARSRTTIEAVAGPLLEELGYLNPDALSPVLRTLWRGTGAIGTTFHRVDRLVRSIGSDIQRRR